MTKMMGLISERMMLDSSWTVIWLETTMLNICCELQKEKERTGYHRR
jgi:hypothetical protein